jgi:hypothetical protein
VRLAIGPEPAAQEIAGSARDRREPLRQRSTVRDSRVASVQRHHPAEPDRVASPLQS